MPANRCPMCHHANEGTAWQCRRCGYEFGQDAETVRGLLRDQLRRSRISFWIAFVVEVAVLSAFVYLVMRGYILFPWLPVLLVTWWLVRARQKIAISRHSLALIDQQQAPLPKATLRSERQ